MKRSAITGIRIKDDVYQQLIAYHQENYPDTPFVVSHTILELIQKGLGNNVKQDVKQNVKQDDEYITKQDFDTFKENIGQQINELNSLLNGTLNTSENETTKHNDNDCENTDKNETIADDGDNGSDCERSYAAAIAIAKEKIIKGETLKNIAFFLSENEYKGKQGKPIEWATRLSRIPEIKALRDKL